MADNKHPMSNTPGKIMQFAQQNPVATVLAVLALLGLIIPPRARKRKSKQYSKSYKKRQKKFKKRKKLLPGNPGNPCKTGNPGKKKKGKKTKSGKKLPRAVYGKQPAFMISGTKEFAAALVKGSKAAKEKMTYLRNLRTKK